MSKFQEVSRATWVVTRQDQARVVQHLMYTLVLQSTGNSCSTQLALRHGAGWSKKFAMIDVSIYLEISERKSEVIDFGINR